VNDLKPAQRTMDGRSAEGGGEGSRHPRFTDALLADARLAAAGRGERHDFRSGLDGLVQALRLMLQTDAFLALAAYRAEVSLKARGVPILPWIAHRIAIVSGQISIADTAVVHPGVLIPNGQVVIYGDTEIQPFVTLLPWVTIGPIGPGPEGPMIRGGVRIGTGARVMGEIEVGANARVGINAVVLDDVPPNTTVVGMPAAPVTDDLPSEAGAVQISPPPEAPSAQPDRPVASEQAEDGSPAAVAPAEPAPEVATDSATSPKEGDSVGAGGELYKEPTPPSDDGGGAIDVAAPIPAAGARDAETATGDGQGPSMAPRSAKAGPRSWLVAALVAAVALLALTLRWIAAHESLFGDELFTYFITTSHSLSGLFDRYDMTESTPPVFYVLGWLSGKLGDPTVWIRLPSVLAGAAAVPVLYMLGTKLGRWRTGLLAAALIAVLPFAVFYGSEARAYGLLVFLLPLSTLAMLRALDERRGRWWALYWLAASLALYTHYIAGLVIALQAVWALIARRERWIAIVATNVAVILAFVPWLGRLDEDTSSLETLSAGKVLADPLRVAFGHPYASVGEVPGLISLLVLVAGAGIAAAALIVARGRGTREWRPVRAEVGRRPGEVWLLGLLVVATPMLTLLYSLLGHSIYNPRNLITILPYLSVLAALLISLLPGRALVAVGTLTVVAALLASVRMLVDYPRPDVQAAAATIESRAPPGTPVIEPVPSEDRTLRQDLAIYLDDRYPLSHDVKKLSQVPDGADAWVVVPNPSLRGSVDVAVAKALAKPIEAQTIPGLYNVSVTEYRRSRPQRGAPSTVTPGVFVGRVNGTSAEVALVTDGQRLSGAYLCDTSGVSPWFRPSPLSLGGTELVTRGGDALGEVGFAGKRVQGDIAVGSGSGSFTARLATGKAGLYHTASGQPGEPGFRETGWIVLPDGTRCGTTDITAQSGYKSEPAPSIPRGKVTDFANPYGF